MTKTLFLDRDGVLNRQLINDYVKHIGELEILPDALKALAEIQHEFDRIVIVTNQRGVGRALMTEEALIEVMEHLVEAIQQAGGRIDGYYYCPHDHHHQCNCRKPKTGMAEQAKRDFPEIEFTNAILIGDFITDMELGKRLGMKTLFLHKGVNQQYCSSELVDGYGKNFGDLMANGEMRRMMEKLV